MKKTITLEFDKCPSMGLKRDKCLNVITRKIQEAFKELNEFVIQQIPKGKLMPKKL